MQSLAPTSSKSHLLGGLNLDSLDQVCLISVGAQLCRTVALKVLSLRPMVLSVFKGNQ